MFSNELSPQIICIRGCKCVITSVTFVLLFSTVCFQKSTQICCLIRYKITLFAFVCLFVFTVCFQTSSQMACIVSLGTFVWLLSTVRFQMSPVIAWITLFFKILWLNALAKSPAFTQGPHRAQTIHKKHNVGVGNPDDWWTQNCPPRDCPPVGNSEVGNPVGNHWL